MSLDVPECPPVPSGVPRCRALRPGLPQPGGGGPGEAGPGSVLPSRPGSVFVWPSPFFQLFFFHFLFYFFFLRPHGAAPAPSVPAARRASVKVKAAAKVSWSGSGFHFETLRMKRSPFYPALHFCHLGFATRPWPAGWWQHCQLRGQFGLPGRGLLPPAPHGHSWDLLGLHAPPEDLAGFSFERSSFAELKWILF